MYEDIRIAIEQAATVGQKLATFHYLVLKNAKALEAVDPKKFCIAVGVSEGYTIEFQQMLALKKVMRQEDCQLI